MLETLERFAYRGAKALSVVGLGGLCLLAAMTLADGVGRWLFGASIEGVRDIGGLVIAVAVACCLPMGLIERGHISVEIFAKRSPTMSRAANALASVIVLGVSFAMAWQLQSYAAKLAEARETTWVLQIAVAPFWLAVAAVLWFAVLVQAVMVMVDLTRLSDRRSNGTIRTHEREQSAL